MACTLVALLLAMWTENRRMGNLVNTNPVLKHDQSFKIWLTRAADHMIDMLRVVS